MTVKQDAGNLLLFFYDELINKEKRSVDTQDVVDNIKWNSSRINIAFNFLKSNGWIEKVQPYIGNTEGVQNFRVRELSSQGIGQVEDSKRFEETFGFDVNLISESTIGSQHTERDLNIEKQEAKRDIINVAGDFIIHAPKTQELISIPITQEQYRSLGSLKIFLCHSSGDKAAVRDLYQRLRVEDFIPWLDEENLLPGQKWQQEIPKAVRASDVVIVCLSRNAINKAGYMQKEITFALDVADEQPEGSIFLIPLKLEECVVPERLTPWHWVNLFEEKGFERLMRALQERKNQLKKT